VNKNGFALTVIFQLTL